MTATNTVGKAWIVAEAFYRSGERFDSSAAAMAYAKSMAAHHPMKVFEVFECVAVMVHEPEVRVITEAEGDAA